jgi:signal transduction histidine kinase/CheY-like chemotaxis protein
MHDDSVLQLSAALEKADAAFRSKIDELSFVSRVGEAVSRHTSTRQLSEELVEVIAEATLSKHALLYRRSLDERYELQAASTVFGDALFPASFDCSVIPGTFTGKTGAVAFPDLSAETLNNSQWPFPPGLKSWLFVPLLARDRCQAILILADEEPSSISPASERTLMMVAPQLSRALSNIELYEDLKASEAKCRTFVERMQDAVYICTRDLRIIDSNHAAGILCAPTQLWTDLKDLFVNPETAELFETRVRKEGSIQDFEAEFRSPNGEVLIGLVSAVADSVRVSVIVRDITEQKKLSHQLARTQKMESIGTLASGIAHDFNNILGIILPTAELLQLRDVPDKRGRRLEAIVDASRRGAQLTGQLLAMARDEPPSVEPLLLNDVVQSAEQLLKETLERTVRIHLDLGETLPTIEGDEGELTQMLINFAVNARDAMEGEGSITLQTRAENQGVRLSVHDTGPGIDPDVLDKIFDPFFTTKERGRGTGLVLSMAYATVKRHGGTIHVETNRETGTEFRLWFPMVEKAVKSSKVVEWETSEGRETILVVDDEPHLLELMEISLSHLGYRVLKASNGAQALNRMNADIDLVILDMIMPVMDGPTALKSIRQLCPHTKVLVATGYADPERLTAIKTLGIDGLLPKPFPLSELSETVRLILDGIAA